MRGIAELLFLTVDYSDVSINKHFLSFGSDGEKSPRCDSDLAS